MAETKKIKERLLFSTITGSKLFGTESENSDTDIKGIFLPDIRNLILQNSSDLYDFSTNSNQKNTNDDIDEKYFSLQFFLNLISKGDSNCIDILFAYTNKKCTLHIDPLWEELIKNTDKLISKNIIRSLQICRSQCIKKHYKGEKLNVFINLKNYIKKSIEDNKFKQKLTLESILFKDYNILYDENKKKEYYKNNRLIGYTYSQNLNGISDNLDILKCFSKDNYLLINEYKFPLDERIVLIYEKLNSIINNYGDRTKKASENKGADYKALSHCIRNIFEVEEIINKGKISFPLKDKQLEFVRSIKFKTTKMNYDEIIEWISKKYDEINNKLIKESNLRDNPDKEWIDNFILKCYDNKSLHK